MLKLKIYESWFDGFTWQPEPQLLKEFDVPKETTITQVVKFVLNPGAKWLEVSGQSKEELVRKLAQKDSENVIDFQIWKDEKKIFSKRYFESDLLLKIYMEG